MPPWLLRLLPHGLAVLAIIAAIWWVDHLGYRRAMVDRDARDAKLLALLRADLRISEARLADRIAGIDADYVRQRTALEGGRTHLQPRLDKEIARDTRLADPALGLAPGLLDAINTARAAGACAATASGVIACALPAAPARD